MFNDSSYYTKKKHLTRTFSYNSEISVICTSVSKNKYILRSTISFAVFKQNAIQIKT